MVKSRRLGAVAASLCGALWCGQSVAEPGITPHLGLEASIFTSTSTDTTIPASADTSAETKYVSSSTRSGLPGQAAVSFGLLVGQSVDLGARFGYASSNDKTGPEASALQLESSSYTISPYAAYLSGTRGDTARLTIGLTGGIGSGTSKLTIAGATTAASTNSESTTSLVQYGALAGLRLHASDLLSVDPMVMILKTSSKTSQPNTEAIETSGVTFMLNVGFSLWFGGAPHITAPAASVATGSTSSDSPASATAPVAAGDDTGATGSTSEPAPETEGRITLKFGEGRAITMIAGEPGPDRAIALVLRETLSDSNLGTCNQLLVHAPDQEEIALEGKGGKAMSPTGPLLILKGQATMEQLRSLTVSPGGKDSVAPNHWFDVCGHRWNMRDADRAKLKVYLDGLR